MHSTYVKKTCSNHSCMGCLNLPCCEGNCPEHKKYIRNRIPAFQDWIPATMISIPRTEDSQLTGIHIGSYSDKLLFKLFSKEVDRQIDEMGYKLSNYLLGPIKYPRAIVLCDMYPENICEKCECGSGSNDVGPGHSDWCGRYEP